MWRSRDDLWRGLDSYHTGISQAYIDCLPLSGLRAHLAEVYIILSDKDRVRKVEHVGISVFSDACTTFRCLYHTQVFRAPMFILAGKFIFSTIALWILL